MQALQTPVGWHRHRVPCPGAVPNVPARERQHTARKGGMLLSPSHSNPQSWGRAPQTDRTEISGGKENMLSA